MSRLDELMQELCPNGVGYKKLSDVANIERGKRVVKEQLSQNSGFPVFQNSLTPMGYHTDSNYPAETTFVIGAGAAGEVGYCKEDFWAADDCYPIVCGETIINRFVFHFLLRQQPILLSKVRKASIPRLSRTVIENLMIPVPPLPVQEEIVRILDKFTSLTAELTAELTARRRQYEYYRDALLDFKNTGGGYNVVCKRLGEIATITRGGNFQKKDFVETGLPCIHYGQMYTHFGPWADKPLTFVSQEVFQKSRLAYPNDIVMAVTSENVEDVCKCTAWVGNAPIAVSGHTAIIHHDQNAKFLSYYFQSADFYRQKVKLAHGTKVIEVTPDKLKDIIVPIPPLEIQQRIVHVLDNFDAICADLKIGLPAEIKARKKQYEHYRDMLLGFAAPTTQHNTTQHNTTQHNTTQHNTTQHNTHR